MTTGFRGERRVRQLEAPTGTVLFVLPDEAAIRRVGGVLGFLSLRKYRVHIGVQADPPGAPSLRCFDASYTGLSVAELPRPWDDPWWPLALLVRGWQARWTTSQSAGAGRRRVIDAIDAIEQAIPASAGTTRLLAGLAPTLVIVTRLRGGAHVDYLRAARQQGIRSVYLPLGWEDVSSGLLRNEPADCVAVWNRTQRREAVEQGVPIKRTAVIGATLGTDALNVRSQVSRDEYCRRREVDPARPLFVVAPAGTVEGINGWLQEWNDAVRRSAVRESTLILYVPPGVESAAIDRTGVAHVIDGVGDPFVVAGQLEEALTLADAVLTADMNVALEALGHGRPVVTIVSEPTSSLARMSARMRVEYQWPLVARSVAEQRAHLATIAAGVDAAVLERARGYVRIHGRELEPAFLLATRLIRELPPPLPPRPVADAAARRATRLAGIVSDRRFTPATPPIPRWNGKALVMLVLPSPASVQHWTSLLEVLVDRGHRAVVVFAVASPKGDANTAALRPMHGVSFGGVIGPAHTIGRLAREIAGLTLVWPAVNAVSSDVASRWRGRVTGVRLPKWARAIEELEYSEMVPLARRLTDIVDTTRASSAAAAQIIDRERPDVVIALPSIDAADAIDSGVVHADVLRAARHRGIPTAASIVTGRAIDDALALGALRPRGVSRTNADAVAVELERWLSHERSVSARPLRLGGLVPAAASLALAVTIGAAHAWRAVARRARHSMRTGLRAGSSVKSALRGAGAPRK